MKNKFEFFSLNKAFALAADVAKRFKKDLYIADIVQFADSEIEVRLKEDLNVKGKLAFVIHSTCEPVDEHIMQLLFLIDLLKKRGAKKVHLIIPYFGYSRQCINKKTGKPGNAGIIAKLVETAGADSVTVVEAHNKKLAAFFSIPFCNISLHSLIASHIRNRFEDRETLCLVAPDDGAKERVRAIASMLHLPTVFFSKKRYDINKVEIVGVTGDCLGKRAIIIDDIIDTGSTAMKVADILVSKEVSHVYGYFVHPVLSANAPNALESSVFEKIYVSNSIGLSDDKKIDKIETFDISDALVDYVKYL